MISNHIQDALEQVRELQKNILEKQRFKGYSGGARIIGGTAALLASAYMAQASFPQNFTAHLNGWGLVLLIGVVLNYGALLHWFLFDPDINRDLSKLKPTLKALPPLFVGALLTWVIIQAEYYQLLFGTWMCLYGLAGLASLQGLPKNYWVVGIFYVASGTVYLLTPDLSFLNPWRMGLIFFIGELTGGIILHYGENQTYSFK